MSRGWRVGCLIAVALVAGCGSGSSKHATRSRPSTHAVHGDAAPVAGGRLAVARPVIWGAAARRAAIPILMYHVVSAAPPGVPYPELWVARRTFASEMRALHRAGYHAITLTTALRAWRRGGGLPRRPLVVSFDDGYRSDYTHAAPVLRRLGWPGELNLALANLRPGDITAAEVRRLVAWGWELASHTLTHPDLTTLDPAALRHELVGSREAIQRRFGQPVRAFCYPYGRYDARVIAAVRAAGYQAAMTEDTGLAVGPERFVLRRIRVSGSDTAAGLLARLRALSRA